MYKQQHDEAQLKSVELEARLAQIDASLVLLHTNDVFSDICKSAGKSRINGWRRIGDVCQRLSF